MKIGLCSTFVVALALIGCRVPGPDPTAGGCQGVGVEVTSCRAEPIGPYGPGFSVDSNDIYGKLEFVTSFDPNNEILRGRDAKTFLAVLKRAFHVTKVQTVIVTITPKLGEIQLSQTVVAMLEYSDEGGTPEWKSFLNTELETPWRLMPSDATFSYDISYGVSDQKAADIAGAWADTKAFIPPVGPEVIAAKAAVDTLVTAAQPVINAFMKARGANINSAVKDSMKPLVGPARQKTYVFGPGRKPLVQTVVSVRYRSSMFKGPAANLSELSLPKVRLSDADLIKLPNGSSAKKDTIDENNSAIVSASHTVPRNWDSVQASCRNIRSYLQDPTKIGLSQLDSAVLTARIFSDSPILAKSIPDALRDPCLIEVAKEVAPVGVEFPAYDPTSERAILTPENTDAFFTAIKKMQLGETENIDELSLVTPVFMVNQIDVTQTRANDAAPLIRELGKLAITDFGCYTTAKAGAGEQPNGRIALAKGSGPQRYAFEFWGTPSRNTRNGVSVDYIVIRKPIESDYDPKNSHCQKFR